MFGKDKKEIERLKLLHNEMIHKLGLEIRLRGITEAENKEQKTLIANQYEELQKLKTFEKNCELYFGVLAQASSSWLFGFDCAVKTIPYGAGVEFVLTPVYYETKKFPEIQYYAYRNNDRVETRTVIQQLSNDVLTDIFLKILRETFGKDKANKTIFKEEKEIIIYGLLPNQIKNIVEAYRTACDKYSKILDDVMEKQ
jgi:hypothetical protein